MKPYPLPLVKQNPPNILKKIEKKRNAGPAFQCRGWAGLLARNRPPRRVFTVWSVKAPGAAAFHPPIRYKYANLPYICTLEGPEKLDNEDILHKERKKRNTKKSPAAGSPQPKRSLSIFRQISKKKQGEY
jgi:hypothetical protein